MTDHTDDSHQLSDFVRGENGFKGAPLADVEDARAASIRQDDQNRKDGTR